MEILIDPIPEGKSKGGALYPDGAHLKDLAEVRQLMYDIQRPGIAPGVSLHFCRLYMVFR